MDKRDIVKEIVEKLQPMDIVVTTQGTFSGWWIRTETASEWSHVCLVGANKSIYTTGLRFAKKDAFDYLIKQGAFAVYRMPGLTDTQRMDGEIACGHLVGQFYPIIDVISMKVQNWFKPGSKRLWLDDKNLICSQSVAYIYENRIGIKLAPQRRLHFSMYRPDTCIDDIRLEEVARFPKIVTSDDDKR